MHAQPDLEAESPSVRGNAASNDLTNRLFETARVCSAVVEECLSRLDPNLSQCARLAADCGDIALVAARVAARRTGSDEAVVVGLLMLGEALCRDCAEECERVGELGSIYLECAETCRRGEQACLEARSQRAPLVVQ